MWIMATRKDRSKLVLWDSVCKETDIRFVDSTEVTMVINSNVKSTTCFPHIKGITELAG